MEGENEGCIFAYVCEYQSAFTGHVACKWAADEYGPFYKAFNVQPGDKNY